MVETLERYARAFWEHYGDLDRLRELEEQAQLVADLLTQLGCADVWLESSDGTLPQTNRVRFTPTAEIVERVLKSAARSTGL